MNKIAQIILGLIQVLALSGLSFTSLADEAALYDLAPPDAAFLRVINLQKNTPSAGSNQHLTLRIEGKNLSTAGYCSASSFVYLPAGEYNEQVSGLRWQASLEAGKAYSLLVDDDSVTLVEDYRAKDSRRGMLVVYNFSSYSRLNLQTAKSARSVLSNIAQATSGARAIIPLKSAFSVVDSADTQGTSLVVTEAMIFQPGVSSSLFICTNPSGLFTHWADRAGGR